MEKAHESAGMGVNTQGSVNVSQPAQITIFQVLILVHLELYGDERKPSVPQPLILSRKRGTETASPLLAGPPRTYIEVHGNIWLIS